MKIISNTGFGEPWRHMDISKVQKQIDQNRCLVYLDENECEQPGGFLDVKNIIGLVSDIKEIEDCFCVDWKLLETPAASEVKPIIIAGKGKLSTNIIYDEIHNFTEFHSFSWLGEKD